MNTWSADNIRLALADFSKDELMVVRVAVTGQKVGTPLFESMEIVGKEETLKRLGKAIEILKGLS